ncbi:MAG TPA: hypothetical protein VES93_06690 [Ornithinibacter sp.]|nr:hypothetical protein [Ornithinibacter sp.]
MTTNGTLETIATIIAIGGLAAPVAYLIERTDRRERREHGARTTWAWTRHDADSRRIANEIHALDGAAHR